jgi:hypothetical protein
MSTPSRGTALTTAAVLFAILAGSNLLKPFQILGDQTGFVLLGERLTGTANGVAGAVAGLYLAAYAAGIWGLRRFALPMGRLYAVYVALNLILFPFRTPLPPGAGMGERIFGIVYAAIALGVSWGTVRLLAARRGDLR